jgi:iron(III) transport system ATP-binding protein
MIDGKVLQTGTPADVYTRPVSRAVGEFVGNANFLAGRVKGAVAESELGPLPVTAGFDGPAELMVRAEGLDVSESEGVPGEVTGVQYYGHDQMVTVRLLSGSSLSIRLLATPRLSLGQRVGVVVRGEVFAFPAPA